MAHAIRVETTGGPDVLEYVAVEPPRAGAGEALVRIEAIGVNYIDVYHRTGLYPLATPFTPGSEAAGVVAEVGSGVEGFRPGDRVAYAMVPVAHAAPGTRLGVTIPDLGERVATVVAMPFVDPKKEIPKS